jgi:hypothetical protein
VVELTSIAEDHSSSHASGTVLMLLRCGILFEIEAIDPRARLSQRAI